jgi:hypothetical protein
VATTEWGRESPVALVSEVGQLVEGRAIGR